MSDFFVICGFAAMVLSPCFVALRAGMASDRAEARASVQLTLVR